MSSFRPIKLLLIDAYRWMTWPYRRLTLVRARRIGKVPIAILFYHRVADDHPNPWTISRHEFRQHINWLQKNFEIVSLGEAQRRIRSGFNDRPTVCITFDDGYADNSSFALPLLIKRGIPATYFVTTWNTTSGSPFPHDLRRGRPLATNAIETLRALSAAGVEIGAHTRSHVDLATIVDDEQLFDEVVTATRELETEIGQTIRYFAFPFGQPENLHPRVFQLAQEHGFEGVCTAFGGWNEIDGDSFHLQRFHGHPEIAYLKNWLTLDPRKRRHPQTDEIARLIDVGSVTAANVCQRDLVEVNQ